MYVFVFVLEGSKQFQLCLMASVFLLIFSEIERCKTIRRLVINADLRISVIEGDGEKTTSVCKSVG